ncbi:MAG: hypothetical protein IT376_00405 [Polyangiaceae bacterium]|nr:hypothetical protein [Polyangiaceae bacterium]
MRFLAPLTAVTLASLTLIATPASAEETSPTAKGITGGALLGAEAVTLTEAALGVKPAWAYIVGGLAGGIGGGVGGYFLEQSGDAKLSLYVLAGGMTLVIPTMVAVLSATAYEPPTDYTEDRGVNPDEPVADPAAEEGAAAPRKRQVALRLRRPSVAPRFVAPPTLVDVSGASLRLGVPAVEVRDRFTRREVADLGVKQRAEIRVPVLGLTF